MSRLKELFAGTRRNS